MFCRNAHREDMKAMLSRRMLLKAAWQRRGDHRGCYRRVCGPCGAVFYASRPEATYCRAACRQRAYRRRVRLRLETTAMATGTASRYSGIDAQV